MRTADCRGAVIVAVSSLVEAFDQTGGLLKFRRQQKSRRDISPLCIDAGQSRATQGDLVGPIIKSTSIRLAIEKIQIVLVNEIICIVRIAGSHIHQRYRQRSIEVCSQVRPGITVKISHYYRHTGPAVYEIAGILECTVTLSKQDLTSAG